MNKIVINNKHLTAIAQELHQDFNKVEFLTWYEQIHPDFEYEKGPMSNALVNKYFSGSKQYIKVFELPALEINNEKDLKKLLSYPHGSYREPLIKVLKNEFGIDYWQETLKFACEDDKLGYSAYYGLLSHSMNDYDFTSQNISQLKNFIEGFIDSVNKGKSKRFTEVMQYISFAITNKDLFGNSWIIDNLNQIFKNPDDGSSKQFGFNVDKLSRQFIDLDFTGFRLNPELKKALKGKLPLTTATANTKPFFWEIDIARYCMANKTVQQLLQTNCITGIEIIDRFLKDEADVLSHFVKRDKTKISLAVIHECPKLEEKLNALLDTILKKTELNMVVDKSDFEKALVFLDLNESMVENKIKNKVTKV